MPKKPSNKFTEQIAELTAALQRERADAENIRRRHAEQIINMRDTVKADVIRELLPVIDNFERALKHSPMSSLSEAKDLDSSPAIRQAQNDKKVAGSDKKWIDYAKGIDAIVKQFEKTLADMGVEKIQTVGQSFNPEFHEAVSTEGEGHNEIVSEELQSGYKIGNDVIRHAMVRVKLQ